jgi:hypothetical protein
MAGMLNQSITFLGDDGFDGDLTLFGGADATCGCDPFDAPCMATCAAANAAGGGTSSDGFCSWPIIGSVCGWLNKTPSSVPPPAQPSFFSTVAGEITIGVGVLGLGALLYYAVR